MLSPYDEQLRTLFENARLRRFVPRTGIDFSSNDYLGMASDPRLADAARTALDRGVSLGSRGSRLLRGNDPEHEALEAEAACFYRSEASLFFSSGYAANSALLSTLPQCDDHIFHDELIHASAHEGMRLARCGRTGVQHNDADAFELAIRKWRLGGGKGCPWIVVESLYSMEGDLAPLGALFDVARRHDAFLVIDEAHATGVFGHEGRGLSEVYSRHENVIVVRTLGKALGCEGALIGCAVLLRDFLVNRARGFIFSTAPSPLMAAVARSAIEIVASEDERRNRLRALWNYAAARLERHGAIATNTPVVPLIIGEDAPTIEVAARLQGEGMDVRGIRPPTVPAGTSRLRISLTANVTETDIDRLDEALGRALA